MRSFYQKSCIPIIAVLTFFLLANDLRAAMSASGEMIVVPEYVEAEQIILSGNYEAAIPLLNATLQKFPGHASAWNLLGYTHRMTGKLDKAEQYYDGALTVNPKHTGALNYMGQLFLQTGRPDRAKQLLDRLQQACPQGCRDLEHLKKAVATGVAGKY